MSKAKRHEHIHVAHPNGYVGELYGKSSLVILKDGAEVFHTGYRSINTKEELYEALETFPDFLKVLDAINEATAMEKWEKENGKD